MSRTWPRNLRRARLSALLLPVLCSTAATAHAEWSGKGGIGASFASGNSENQTANAALELKYAGVEWAHLLGFAGNYGNDGSDTTAQRWEVRGQSQDDFTRRFYGFGAARYEDDRFSAFEYQASLSTGVGYKLIDSERTKLWMQGGPGYRFAERRGECLDDPRPADLDDCNDRGPSESEDSLIGHGNVGFDHQLTETTKLVDRFLVEAGSDNTYLQNDLGFELLIAGALVLRVGYQVRHNTDVPPGVEQTDTLTTLGLIYGRD